MVYVRYVWNKSKYFENTLYYLFKHFIVGVLHFCRNVKGNFKRFRKQMGSANITLFPVSLQAKLQAKINSLTNFFSLEVIFNGIWNIKFRSKMEKSFSTLFFPWYLLSYFNKTFFIFNGCKLHFLYVRFYICVHLFTFLLLNYPFLWLNTFNFCICSFYIYI